ncbi:MAG: DNA methyltransferase, partial [Candidatus Poribacteria bacterium]
MRCVFSVMDERKNGIILDPYFGSGTTLIAARILGYGFIGVDISQDCCNYADERIRNYKNEEKFAVEEMS